MPYNFVKNVVVEGNVTWFHIGPANDPTGRRHAYRPDVYKILRPISESEKAQILGNPFSSSPYWSEAIPC